MVKTFLKILVDEFFFPLRLSVRSATLLCKTKYFVYVNFSVL